MDEKDIADILPDTNVDRERTLTGKWALGLFALVFCFTLVAFCTSSWIAGDPKFYGTKVEEVGLWVHCFRSLPDYNDPLHQRYFAGCRWLFNPFTEGYGDIRSFLAPPFFVATQFFYTINFIGILLALILILMYLLCIQDHHRVTCLRWTGIDLIIAAVLGTLALLIFGTMADGEEFMPDWQHNYLSWSFGLAFVGVFFSYVDGILFIVEARIMQRKEIAQEMRFPMEQRV
ncbi:uncharacterized protein LOC131883143 [Tigriopus californicus]|uniref:uncharacterized protein LOC131883143 n=1 Tax=Tigriopus californicus TaxID=6832 RepID=UPI0027D9D36E|nr:uncharacterized protein LOC131883143 [Tigriopus californicus]